MFVYFSKNIAFYKFFRQALLIKISNYILPYWLERFTESSDDTILCAL